MSSEQPLNINEVINQHVKALLPIVQSRLGTTRTKILEYCTEAKTTPQLEDLLNVHYQTAYEHVKDLLSLGLLVKSESRTKAGFLYLTNQKGIINLINSDPFGRSLIQKYGIDSVLLTKNEPVVDDNTETMPEPKDNITIKVGQHATNIWKFLIGCKNNPVMLNAPLVIASSVFHQWYRNYMLTAGGVNIIDAPSPTGMESRQALIGIRTQLQEQLKVVDTLIQSDLFWEDDPNTESWRMYGDFPVRVARYFSNTFTELWEQGMITDTGIPYNVNHNYNQCKVDFDMMYANSYKPKTD